MPVLNCPVYVLLHRMSNLAQTNPGVPGSLAPVARSGSSSPPGSAGLIAVSGLSALDVHCRTMQYERGRTRAASRGPARRDGNLMAEYSPVTDMVARAKNGEKQAWDEIV